MTIEVNRLPRPDAAKHPGDFTFELFPGQLKTPPKNSGFRLRTRCQSPFRKRSTPALVIVIGPNSRRYIQAARRCYFPAAGLHTLIRGNKTIGLMRGWVAITHPNNASGSTDIEVHQNIGIGNSASFLVF